MKCFNRVVYTESSTPKASDVKWRSVFLPFCQRSLKDWQSLSPIYKHLIVIYLFVYALQAGVKAKKATETYKSYVEKYATAKSEFEQKMTETAQVFISWFSLLLCACALIKCMLTNSVCCLSLWYATLLLVNLLVLCVCAHVCVCSTLWALYHLQIVFFPP